MDEFDKIRELSEDLTNRREPTFTGQNANPFANRIEPAFTAQQPRAVDKSVFENLNKPAEPLPQTPLGVPPLSPLSQQPTENFGFNRGFDNFAPIEPVEEKSFPTMKWHLIALFVFILILAVVLGGFFMFNESENESEEIVTITATGDVVKEAPAQAGGINIPDQDKLVYNRIRSDNLVTKVESLFPEPEKPVQPQILTIEETTQQETFVKVKDMKAVNPLDEVSKEKVVVAVQEKVEKVTENAPVYTPKKQEQTVKETLKEVVTPVTPVREVVPEAPKKEIIPLKPVEKAKEEIKETGGVWKIQLFASNNKAAVEKAWKRILNANSNLLSNLSYNIKKVDIPKKGAFYRLQVGQFQTREMAESVCVKLRARKQDCIPAK